jgi:hypothetical protein
MTEDRAALIAVAERIAEAENRASQLRERVERLRNEGSDAAQAQETLQVVSRNLANLYVQQAVLRRTVWAWHFAKADRSLRHRNIPNLTEAQRSALQKIARAA